MRLREQYDIPLDKIVLMFCANRYDNPFKGIETLVGALDLVENKKRFHLLIVGNSDELVFSNKYTISRTGYVENEKIMYELYTMADVLIMPSNAENFSCTILESMSCGTPVIGSDVGGIPEQVTEETGWVFPAKDVKALSELIDNLLYLDAMEMEDYRRLCRKRICEKFSEKKMLDEYYKLYKEVLLDKD